MEVIERKKLCDFKCGFLNQRRGCCRWRTASFSVVMMVIIVVAVTLAAADAAAHAPEEAEGTDADANPHEHFADLCTFLFRSTLAIDGAVVRTG